MGATPTPVRFGALDLVRGPGGLPHPALPDGGAVGTGGEVALATCENLRPAGRRPDAPGGYTPVRLPSRVLACFGDGGALGAALSAHYQVRERAADLDSTGTAALLRRWLVLTEEKLWALDPADPGDGTTAALLHTFAAVDAGRTATFAPMGAEVLVATRDGDGGPGETLLVGDDSALAYGGVPFGDLRITDETTPPSGTRDTYVFYRCALTLPDGSTGPAGPLRKYFGEAASGVVTAALHAGDTLGGGPGGLSVPAAWQARASGVGLYVGMGTTPEEALAAPLQKLRELTWDEIADVPGWSDAERQLVLDPDRLAGNAELVDAVLTAHGIRAATCAAYNRRLFLGAAAYDLAEPVLGRPAGTTDGRYTVHVRLRLAGGDTWVVGDVVTCPDSGVWAMPGDGISYPDRRAVEAEIYRSPVGNALGTRKRVVRVDLTAPPGMNAAYSIVTGAVPEVTGAEPDEPERAAAVDYDPNRVLLSEPLAPLDVRAASAFYVGDGPDDAVTAVLPLAEPLSEGQYGEYPLVLVCRRSAWSLGFSGALISGVAPIWNDRGARHPRALAVALGAAWGACADGLQGVRPGAPSLSHPVETAAALAALADGAALGYLASTDGGELWVAVPAHAGSGADAAVYCLHLPTGRWYTRPLDRVAFARVDGAAAAAGLVGIDSDGSLWVEDADEPEGDDTVPVALSTGAISCGLARVGRLRVRHAMLEARGTIDGAANVLDAPTGALLGMRGTGAAPADLVAGGFGVVGGSRDAVRVTIDGGAAPGAVVAGVLLDAEGRRTGRLRYDTAHGPASPGSGEPPAAPDSYTP